MAHQVFQVKGVSESHPEYAEWVTATYSDQAAAEMHKAFLTEFLAQVVELDRQNGNTELECALRTYHPLDSGYLDCGGVVYSVVPVEVRDGPFLPGLTLKGATDGLVAAVKAGAV